MKLDVGLSINHSISQSVNLIIRLVDGM